MRTYENMLCAADTDCVHPRILAHCVVIAGRERNATVCSLIDNNPHTRVPSSGDKGYRDLLDRRMSTRRNLKQRRFQHVTVAAIVGSWGVQGLVAMHPGIPTRHSATSTLAHGGSGGFGDGRGNGRHGGSGGDDDQSASGGYKWDGWPLLMGLQCKRRCRTVALLTSAWAGSNALLAAANAAQMESGLPIRQRSLNNFSPRERLAAVPVFFVSNGRGSPYLLNREKEGVQECLIFLDPDDAETLVHEMTQASPQLKDARVFCIGLDRALAMAQRRPMLSGNVDRNGRELTLRYRFQPAKAQIEAASIVPAPRKPKLLSYLRVKLPVRREEPRRSPEENRPADAALLYCA